MYVINLYLSFPSRKIFTSSTDRYVKLKIYGHKLPNVFYKFHSYSKVPKGKYIFLTERQTIPLTSERLQCNVQRIKSPKKLLQSAGHCTTPRMSCQPLLYLRDNRLARDHRSFVASCRCKQRPRVIQDRERETGRETNEQTAATLIYDPDGRKRSAGPY